MILDSLTTLGEASLRSVLGNAGHLEQHPQIQEWSIAMSEVERCLVYLRGLPTCVVVIAHQDMTPPRTMLDGTVVEKDVQVWAIGNKLGPKIPAYFDEVWYMKPKLASQGKVEYKIQTKHSGRVLARSRYNLPDGIDANLGMVEILKTLWEFSMSISINDHEEAMEAVNELISWIQGHVPEKSTEEDLENLDVLGEELEIARKRLYNMYEEIEGDLDDREDKENEN